MTDFVFPVHVDVRTGKRRPPSGIDPYEDTVWCEGSFSDRSEAFRKKYDHKITELRDAQRGLKETT